MTFSIVAFDNNTNEVGFAISSCCWNAGANCLAKAGKGVITHQAKGEAKFHNIFFDQLNLKKSLDEILVYFKNIDNEIESRQIGMISVEKGSSLSFTGKYCSFWSGHKTGKNYACQGNMLVGPEVVDAMTQAFENTEGALIDKLFAAIHAGDYAGGDARGKQSARLQVLTIDGRTNNVSVKVDFNITDHDDPVNEIGRLLKVRQNYQEINSLFRKFQQEQSDSKRQIVLIELLNFMNDKKESRYMTMWTELGYAFYTIGDIDNTVKCYKTVLKISPTMDKTIEAAAKAIGVSDSIIKQIIEK